MAKARATPDENWMNRYVREMTGFYSCIVSGASHPVRRWLSSP